MAVQSLWADERLLRIVELETGNSERKACVACAVRHVWLACYVSLVGSCREFWINVAGKLRTLQRKSAILCSVGALSVFQAGGLRRSSQ